MRRTGIDLPTVLSGSASTPAASADAIHDACSSAYLADFPDADLKTFTYLDAEFLFDANPRYDRTVLVVGQPTAPTDPRDESYQRGYPLTQRVGGRRVDRGHFIPFTSGGSFGPNLFVQDRALNRGWSREGRQYRALERRAAATPRGLMFAHAIYIDELPVPAFVQLGLVTGSGHEHQTFRNRFDEPALIGSDRLLVELGGATDDQIGGLGEDTVALLLEEENDAIVVNLSDGAMERNEGRQDLDLVAVLDGELVAFEVKSRYTAVLAGKFTRAGNLPSPRLRSTTDLMRQASQPYVTVRIADVIDVGEGYDGVDVRVAAVDFVAMVVQFFNVNDNGRGLSPLGPPVPCREYAARALARILEHRGHL